MFLACKMLDHTRGGLLIDGWHSMFPCVAMCMHGKYSRPYCRSVNVVNVTLYFDATKDFITLCCFVVVWHCSGWRLPLLHSVQPLVPAAGRGEGVTYYHKGAIDTHVDYHLSAPLLPTCLVTTIHTDKAVLSQCHPAWLPSKEDPHSRRSSTGWETIWNWKVPPGKWVDWFCVCTWHSAPYIYLTTNPLSLPLSYPVTLFPQIADSTLFKNFMLAAQFASWDGTADPAPLVVHLLNGKTVELKQVTALERADLVMEVRGGARGWWQNIRMYLMKGSYPHTVTYKTCSYIHTYILCTYTHCDICTYVWSETPCRSCSKTYIHTYIHKQDYIYICTYVYTVYGNSCEQLQLL